MNRRKERVVADIQAGDRAYDPEAKADEIHESFTKPRHERHRIITGICDRLVGDLGQSLHAAEQFCSSLDSDPPARTKSGAPMMSSS
jgi:hypothetical protein